MYKTLDQKREEAKHAIERKPLIDFDCYDIESMTEQEVASVALEKLSIKGFDVYFVDFGGYFGYSALVFGRGCYIFYANDYQLHHNGKSAKELRSYYIKQLEKKLYTEAEIMSAVVDYDDYSAKDHFVRSFYPMMFETVSIFGIGKELEEIEKKKEGMKYCEECFCYTNDEELLQNTKKYFDHLMEEYKKILNDKERFRQAIAHELWNHEACITCDYSDAVRALGIHPQKLSDWQRAIAYEELDKCIDEYLAQDRA